MENLNEIFEYIKKIFEIVEKQENKGLLSIIISISLLILLPLLIFVLYKKTNSLIDQHLKKYENTLSNISQIVLQNVEISKDIKTSTIEKGNDIRISVYQEAYSLFFEIQHALEEMKDTNTREKLYQELNSKIHNLRVHIFINSIFLNELTDPLLNIQISLWDILTIQYLKCSGKSYDSIKDISCWSNFHKNIQEAENLIRDSMKTYLSLKDTDFSKSLEQEINETKNKYVKENIVEMN